MYNINEDLIREITKKVLTIIEENNDVKIPVGISNRHIHISENDLKILFGENHKLTKYKDLKQPGQFAANEVVTLKGPRGIIENVRILGPVRPETQIELSLTDGFKLGIDVPVRASGKIKNTPGIEIIGPNRRITKISGVIAALRHIHMPTEIGEKLNLKDKEFVDVEIDGVRKATLGNVLVRISDKFKLELHLDMDEANSCSIKNGDMVKIK